MSSRTTVARGGGVERFWRFGLLWCVIFMVMLISPVNAIPGTLTNASFETSTVYPPVSWTNNGVRCGVQTGVITTGTIPDGTNKLRLTGEDDNVNQGSCSVFAVELDGSDWSTVLASLNFYIRIASDACPAASCEAGISVALFDNVTGKTFTVFVNVREETGNLCTDVSWTGSTGRKCYDVQAPCYGAVSATFCRYSQPTFYNDVQALCSNCLTAMTVNGEMNAEVYILDTVIQPSQTHFQVEFDRIYFGACELNCAGPSSYDTPGFYIFALGAVFGFGIYVIYNLLNPKDGALA